MRNLSSDVILVTATTAASRNRIINICSIHFIASEMFFFFFFYIFPSLTCTILIGRSSQADLCVPCTQSLRCVRTVLFPCFIFVKWDENERRDNVRRRERERESYLSVIIMYRRRYFICTHTQYIVLFLSSWAHCRRHRRSFLVFDSLFLEFCISEVKKKCIFLSSTLHALCPPVCVVFGLSIV